MRPSRIFRLIIRMLLLLLTLSISLVSFLGGLSAALILGDPNNIDIQTDEIEANLDITDPGNMNITIPYNITNAGYFDLTNLQLWIKIKMTYSHWGYTGLPFPNDNKTLTVEIFNKTEAIGTIIAGGNRFANFTGTGEVGGGFLTANIPDWDPFTGEINYYQAINFTLDIVLSCSYSLELLDLRVAIYDFPIASVSLL